MLDLSAIGYEYAGAGQCGVTGGKSVHLVYRPREGSSHTQPISLWIRADAERAVPIESGQVYAATPVNAPHPILVWRRGSEVFYLTGVPTEELIEPARVLAKQ